MPFITRCVEPKFLSRKPLDNSVKDDLEAVTNATLVEALKQLACLVVFADEIFQDLTSQVKVIQSRTEKLKSTIGRVDQVVSKLNAKEVAVPVGTLDDFARIRHHYVSSHPLDKNVFVGSTRPEVVRRLYRAAVVTPVCLMRQIDPYRQDGRRCSKYFMCLPFFKDVKVNFDVEIEMRRPASLNGARDWLSDDDTLDSIILGTQFSETDGSSGDASSLQLVSAVDDDVLRQLPTPEEKTYVLSLKYPYKDVPIDVTGYGFRRMTTLRKSFLQHIESIAKRKKRGKRRNTVTGGVGGEDVAAALDEANKKNVQRSTAGTQTGDVDGSEGESKSSRKKKAASQKKQSDKTTNGDGRDDGRKDEAKEKENSSGFRWFQRKARNRNSIIGGIGLYEELDRVKKWRRGASTSPVPATVSEDDGTPSKSSTGGGTATVRTGGPGRAHAKNRISLPISTTSQTLAVAVKLRENSARGGGPGKEDGGQSSSGNWSASSSTRTSMESEEPVRTTVSPDPLNRTGSQTSLDKDSALSDGMTPNDERWRDPNNGYPSDGSSARKSYPRFYKRSTKTDTARWLRSLEEEGALGRSASETTDAASSTGTLTPKFRRRTRSPFDVHPIFVDDGESSEFSVDTDGYYTSMHTDSGLRPLPIRSRQEVGSTLSKLSDVHERGSSSSLCSLGSSSKNSSSSKKATSSNDTSNKDSSDRPSDAPAAVAVTSKKVPPPPPPRTSTLSACSDVERGRREDSPTQSASSVEMDKDSTSNSVTSSVYRSDGAPSAAPSDSEVETGEKLKRKTAIDAGRIPSLCVVTPNQSDDEEDVKGEIESDVLRAAVEVIDAIAKVERDDVHTSPTPPPSSWSIRPSSADSADRTPSDYRTLPKSFARNAASCPPFTHTWPRRPHPLVYRPETISVADRKTSTGGVPASHSLPPKSLLGMSTFAPSNSRSSPRSSPTGCPEDSVSGNDGPASGRPGARVTLDSSGRVIRSTGSLPRRSHPASPTGSATQDRNQPIRTASGAPVRQGAYVRLDPSGSITSPSPDRSLPMREASVSPSPFDEPRLYHSHTLPRWKPSHRDVPVAVGPGARTFPPYDRAGTIPRRWNHFGFLRREASLPTGAPQPPPPPPSSSSLSEPFDSSKSGAYVRLDGHPTHLEPGTPSKAIAHSSPLPSPSRDSSVTTSARYAHGAVRSPTPALSIAASHVGPSRIPVPSFAATPMTRGPTNALPPYYRPMEPDGTKPNPLGYSVDPHGQRGLPTRMPPPSYGVHSTMAAPVDPRSGPFVAPPRDGTSPPKVTVSPSAGGPRYPWNGSSHPLSQLVAGVTTRGPVSPTTMAAVTPPHHFKPPSPQWQRSPPMQGSSATTQRAQTFAGDPTSRWKSPSSMTPSPNARLTTPSPIGRPTTAVPLPSSVHVIPSTPPSTRWASSTPNDEGRDEPKSPEDVGRDPRTPKSTMSTDDLFSIIHQSKKRMNVKSDLERSLSPPSSRSSSPAFSVSSLKSVASTRGRLPETGVLSPRSRSPLCLPGDRRSWAGDPSFSLLSPASAPLPPPTTVPPPGDRRSWASDRLGPIRPTSMHDFKLLLLQAGRGVTKEPSDRRRSASELLKSPPPTPSKDASPVRPPGLSSSPTGRSTPPYEGPTSSPHRPSPRMNLLCSRLQAKHVQSRARVGSTALHSRTDILSTPIPEDEYAEEDAGDGAPDSFLLVSPQPPGFHGRSLLLEAA